MLTIAIPICILSLNLGQLILSFSYVFIKEVCRDIHPEYFSNFLPIIITMIVKTDIIEYLIKIAMKLENPIKRKRIELTIIIFFIKDHSLESIDGLEEPNYKE